MNEETLFDQARKLAKNERNSFLDQACAENPELRSRVEALLAADAAETPSPVDRRDNSEDRTGVYIPSESSSGVEILKSGSGGKSPGSVGTNEEGTIIAGRYKLRQQIGEGGMGTVWMADQTEPVKRKVAVKLIRVERGQSKAILARFEAERQAIAMMDHPNIAKLLDAGTTPEGSPFFVMELVKGVPLNEFCDNAKMSIQERLDLFSRICSAVQHAHQKGIIHRDLKPSNILVESHDGKPVPKVIDFGLAKATTGISLTEESLFTAFGSVMGTPLYMAPEQANFNAIDIDTRADVYSLGVILYEMLTGTTPIVKEALKKAAMDEMLRMIREDEAPTPSSRIESSQTTPSAAASRRIEPGRLGRFVKGDLDWIVMKALSKERERRYESANAFAEDIKRFMDLEPVLACPPSTAYRVKKFVRKHRGPVLAAAAVVAALIMGVVGTTLGWLEANKQKTLAMESAENERIAKEKEAERADGEKKANELAQNRLKDVVRANEILSSIFLSLNPDEVKKEELSLRQLLLENLERAADRMAKESIGDPTMTAQNQQTFGVSMIALGSPKKARTLLEAARDTYRAVGGPEDRNALRCESNIAQALSVEGRLKESIALYEEVIPRLRKVFGPEHEVTFVAIGNLGVVYNESHKFEKGIPLLEEMVRLIRSLPNPSENDLIMSMNNLSNGYQECGQTEKARPLLEEAIELSKKRYGSNHVKTLLLLNNLGGMYHALGLKEKALETSRIAMNGLRTVLGNEHQTTLVSMNNVASYLKEFNRLDEALPIMEEILRVQTAKAGPEHPLTINFLMNLAGTHMVMGKPEKAIPMMRDAAFRRLHSLGPDNDLTEKQIMTFLNLCRRYANYEGAFPLLEETIKISRDKPGPKHSRTLGYLTAYATLCNELKRTDLGIPILEEILAIRKATLASDDPKTCLATNNLATGYWKEKRYDKSIPLFEALLAIHKKNTGESSQETAQTIANLGINYRDAGRFKEAIPLLKQSVEASERYPSLSPLIWDLLAAYQRGSMTKELEELVKQIQTKIDSSTQPNSAQRGGALAELGSHLVEEKAWVLSEPILRESLAIRQKVQPDTWSTFNTMSMLGGALMGQKKTAEAEPLLTKGWEGLKAREKTVTGTARIRLTQALERLIEWNQIMNRPEEVQKYRLEMKNYENPFPGTPKPPEKK